MPEPALPKYKPILLILAVGLLLYSGMNISSTLLHSWQNKQRLQDLQQQVAQLRTNRDTLRQKLNYEQSSQFIEQTARNQLGMARPNETVIIFPRPQDVLSVTTHKANPKTSQSYIAENFDRWISFFLN